MKWINFLKENKIPYYVYKLNQSDSIIIYNKNHNDNKFIIVLYGSIYTVKNFSNQEILPIAILNKNSIFINTSNNHKFYYTLTALEKTYLLTFQSNILNREDLSISLDINLVEIYKKTLKKYEIMNEIISQRYLENRIIQLILSMCIEFGVVKHEGIYIPFTLSQKDIATMTGTTKTTVNKIMQKMYKNGVIKYSNKKIIYIKDIFDLYFK